MADRGLALTKTMEYCDTDGQVTSMAIFVRSNGVVMHRTDGPVKRTEVSNIPRESVTVTRLCEFVPKHLAAEVVAVFRRNQGQLLQCIKGGN